MKTSEESSGNPALSSNSYETYARPLTARLLRALEMNVHYYNGRGNWVEANIEGKTRRLLDFAGSYGANLFGHKNPRLIARAQQYLSSGEPNFTQGSTRATAGLLAERISLLLTKEIGEGPWVGAFSNSGTEAVEAALKHCLLSFSKLQLRRRQTFQKSWNEAKLFVDRLEESMQTKLLHQWRRQLLSVSETLKTTETRRSWLLHMAQQAPTLTELLEVVAEYNQLQLSEAPLVAALERSYHGKTLGALGLTHNPKYRVPFYVEPETTVFLRPTLDERELTSFFDAHSFSLIELIPNELGVYVGELKASRLAGLFVEPIQGESGVHVLPQGFLTQLKKFSLQFDFALVFDEIQAGMFRTGMLASGHHSGVSADIYCFSKALGGGLAKLGVTCIRQSAYEEDFGLLHTSTFAEDGFSASVALEALDVLETPDTIQDAMEKGQQLQEALASLKESYPELVHEVRGKGLMQAIEFSASKLAELSFEFRVFQDAGMLGYLLCSALLHHENLRLTPSLSNGITLRVQPSLFVTDSEIQFFIRGVESMLRNLRDMNFTYFFEHLYPGAMVSNTPGAVLRPVRTDLNRPLAVFLCHFIDDNHIKLITPAFGAVPSALLDQKIALLKEMAQFGEYHIQPLKNAEGKLIDVMLMGVPITSAELKKSFLGLKTRDGVLDKVQTALDRCHALGASTVGLGQFTSIVTGNGLFLNSHGMNLTTGNAFTIALALQSARKSAAEKGIDLATASVGIVGAAGNIMSVASALMADEARRLVLIHHTDLVESPKLQQALSLLLHETLRSERDSLFNRELKRRLRPEVLESKNELLNWITSDEQNDLICVTKDLAALKDCSLILTGASSGKGFLTPEHFGANAVVVDVAVPANIRPEVLKELSRSRPDVTYSLGGIARLPHEQSIVSQIFPLPANQSFACMAETFALGFSDSRGQLHIGNLTKDLVRKVEHLCATSGFTLAGPKTKNSL